MRIETRHVAFLCAYIMYGLPLPDNQMAQGDGVDDVAATDDANQPALAHYWHALDFAFCEQGSNVTDGRLFVDGRNCATHDVGHEQPVTVKQPMAVDFANDVCLGDDTYKVVAGIDYRKSANTKLVE